MKITEIQIAPIKPKNGLIAFAGVVLDDCIYLGSIGIYRKLDGSGFRLTYPTRKVGESNINIFHPIRKEISKAIENAITAKVNRLLN